jgi:ABC-type transport system involved in Fe-S cluster assembly fused permease/ATPase subunit
MKKIRNTVSLAWLGIATSIIYIIYLVSTSDPRLDDGSLTVGEMNIIEAAVFLFSWITIFIFWFYTVFKAFESRRFGWLALTLFLWPLYPIYLWRFANESERNEN